jgi:RimJ/RimL family protein N-acetyltransferase
MCTDSEQKLAREIIRRMTRTIPYPLELVTERLVIRSPSRKDAEGLRDAIEESLDDLRPWMPWADHALTLAEAVDNCAKAVRDFRDGKDHRLHFFLKESNILLGSSGLHRIDWSVPKFEIGYWIRRSQSGNGYATEAVEAISRYAFDELGSRRVVITTSPENEKSCRVAERLGFALDGTLRNDCRNTDGSLRDTRIYAKIAKNDERTR